MNRPVGEIPVALRAEEELAAPAAIERLRVLLVDDDERNLLAIATVLEDLGEIVLARSGEQALRHLLKGEFAVILLDVYMPGMDGYETAQIIRAREQTKRIPIVFLSAVNKEAEHLIRGYEMGAVDYVFKPVDPLVLHEGRSVRRPLRQVQGDRAQGKPEQALLDVALRANAERLKAEQDLRRGRAAAGRNHPVAADHPLPRAAPVRSARLVFVSGDLHALTGFNFSDVVENPHLWHERLHQDDRACVGGTRTARANRTPVGGISLALRRRHLPPLPRPGGFAQGCARKPA